MNLPTAAQAPAFRFMRRMRGSEFVRDSAIVFAATMTVNVLGFVFHALVSRRLGVQDYGALYALFALLPIVGVPTGILSTTLAKYAAEFSALGDSAHLRALLMRLGMCVGIAAVCIAAIVALLQAPISEFLHVPQPAVVATGLLLGVAITIAPLRSILQGVQDFRNFAVSSILEGLLKTALGVALVAMGFSVGGAIFGYAAGSAVAAVYTWLILERRYCAPAARDLRVDVSRLSQTLFGAFVLVLTMSVLSYADALLVKHFMSPTQAGLYAAASLGGKILLFAAGFVPMVLLPKATAATYDVRGPLRPLAVAGAMWAAISLGGLAAFYLVPGFVLRSLVGGQFMSATHLLFLYAIAMVLLSGMSIVGNYKLALHRFDFVVPFLAATVGEIAGIALYHQTLESIIYVLIAGNALALAASLYRITHWNSAPEAAAG